MVKKNKRDRKKKAEERLQKTVGMFDKMPNGCLVCGKDFNKTDKKMVNEWKVIVNNEPASVKLYCPTCWDQAKQTLEYINKQQIVEDKVANQQETQKDGYGAWTYNLTKKREK